MPRQEPPLKTKIKLAVITVGIVGIFLFVSLHFSSKAYVSQIKEHEKQTTGIIISYNPNRYGTEYTYRFVANHKTYTGISPADADYVWERLVDQHFLVVYDSLEPETSSMLVLQGDFKPYGIAYPDSLIPIINGARYSR